MLPTCWGSKRESNCIGQSWRWSVFLAGSCLLAVIWLAMLPKLNSIDHLRREIELLEQRGIDPSAMFYTELDAMERVHDKVREAERLHHEAFWMPSYAIERKETGPSPLQ